MSVCMYVLCILSSTEQDKTVQKCNTDTNKCVFDKEKLLLALKYNSKRKSYQI